MNVNNSNRPAHNNGIRPGSTWRHVTLGYLSVVDRVDSHSVTYSRIAAKTKFKISTTDFLTAYHYLYARQAA